MWLYLDDSGESVARAVGGCVAPSEAWAVFDAEWANVCRDFDVSWIHAVDLQQRSGLFKGWTIDRRDDCLRALVAVLRRTIAISGGYICTSIPQHALSFLKRPNVGKSRKRPAVELRHLNRDQAINDPYCVAMAVCFKAAFDWVPKGKQLQIVVAYQQGHSEQIATAYSLAVELSPFRARLGSISHDRGNDPRRMIRLQAADFAAYYLTRMHRRGRDWPATALHPRRMRHPDPPHLFEGWA